MAQPACCAAGGSTQVEIRRFFTNGDEFLEMHCAAFPAPQPRFGEGRVSGAPCAGSSASADRRRAVAARVLVAALVLLVALAAPALAKPALWVVRSPTATVYLFGTVHILKPDTPWRSPMLEQAFNASRELWLEIDDGGSYTAAYPLMLKLGTDYRKPLSSKLSKDTLDKVDAALRANGITEGRKKVEWYRPWVVAQMVGKPMKSSGVERGSGVDLSLQEDAAEVDKPVRALETKEQQFRIFADLPPTLEVAYLEDSLAHRNDPDDKLGDMEKGHDGPVGDELYRRIFVERNKNWARKIQEILRGSGTIMIAGGAGHFAGPDSVLVQLQRLGIKAERLQ
jgi:uncharacterized protein YbaP (TraB family)